MLHLPPPLPCPTQRPKAMRGGGVKSGGGMVEAGLLAGVEGTTGGLRGPLEGEAGVEREGMFA